MVIEIGIVPEAATLVVHPFVGLDHLPIFIKIAIGLWNISTIFMIHHMIAPEGQVMLLELLKENIPYILQ